MNRWIRSRRLRLVLFGLGLAACSAIWAGMADGDSPEVREIKEQFLRQAGRIASLEVSYSLAETSGLTPAGLRALAGFRNKLYLAKADWTEAVKGEKRYRRELQPETVEYLAETDEFGLVPPQPADPNASALVQKNQQALKSEYDRAIANMKTLQARGGLRRPKKDAGRLDPMERDVTRAFNGRTLWMRRPRDAKVNEIQVWPMLDKGHWFGSSAYLSAVGMQPEDPTAKGQVYQRILRLADWFKDHAYAIEKTEAIDGSTCVVLKGNLNDWFKPFATPAILATDVSDWIWLDRDHGWAVRRREHRKDDRVVMRWETSALREVEPGLWLPTVVRHEQFAEDAPADWRGKPVVTEEIRVKTIEINKVADDRFDLVTGKDDVIEDLRGRF